MFDIHKILKKQISTKNQFDLNLNMNSTQNNPNKQTKSTKTIKSNSIETFNQKEFLSNNNSLHNKIIKKFNQPFLNNPFNKKQPKPKKYERKKSFISRCIPELINEGREQDQSIAICYSILGSKKTNKTKSKRK